MLDLEQHLLRQMAFSRATFGPGARTAGVSDHIRKELLEVQSAPTSFAEHREWVDVVILALDGLTRSLLAAGYTPAKAAETAERLILEKQSANEQRNWPDWRTSDPDKAIEHVRTGDSVRSETTPQAQARPGVAPDGAPRPEASEATGREDR